jgi:hypothetical protein
MQRKNPVIDAAVRQASLIYDEIPLKDFIDEERRSVLARELFLEVNRICNTINPEAECREHFAATMLKLASYQVLVIPPVPEEDVSGLRGQPGVTGELKEHIVRLCVKNDDLRSTMYGLTEPDQFDEVWEILQRLYWETYWLLGTLNAIRLGLRDTADGDDWYQAFLHATCVNLEHTYRWELELPPAFAENVAREAAEAYSVFTDIVLSGAADPCAEWRDYSRGMDIPKPQFERPDR